MMPRVLVIIPAFNESESIASVLEALHKEEPGYDVVVVDDGSSDNTAAIVRASGYAQLVRLPFNLGIGSAMQTGYKYALRGGYDVAVQCDADGQHPVHQIRLLVDRLAEGDVDLVIGSRYVADTDYRPSFSRRVGKSFLSRLVDSVVGGGITDTTSGFRAANRAVIETFAQYYPDDYPEAEALVIVYKRGLRSKEISVDMKPRQGGRSSINWRRAVYYIVKVSLAVFIGVFKKITRTGGHGPARHPEGTADSPVSNSEGKR